MRSSTDKITQLVLKEHKEADKNLIRRKNQIGKIGEEALREKLRKQERREVEKQNKALQKALAEDETLDKTIFKEYKLQELAYGVMPIDDYVEMLQSEIKQEDE